jgi:hypothetical protein
MLCKIPYQVFLCFVGRFLKKGQIVKQCYACRRYKIEGKWTYKIAAVPSRIEYGVCPKCIPGEVERVGKLIEREMNKISSTVWMKPKDEMVVASFNKINEIVDWINAHEIREVDEMDRKDMNELYGWHNMANGDVPKEGQIVIARTVYECEEYQILRWQEDYWSRQDGGHPYQPFNYVRFWKPFKGMV